MALVGPFAVGAGKPEHLGAHPVKSLISCGSAVTDRAIQEGGCDSLNQSEAWSGTLDAKHRAEKPHAQTVRLRESDRTVHLVAVHFLCVVLLLLLCEPFHYRSWVLCMIGLPFVNNFGEGVEIDCRFGVVVNRMKNDGDGDICVALMGVEISESTITQEEPMDKCERTKRIGGDPRKGHYLGLTQSHLERSVERKTKIRGMPENRKVLMPSGWGPSRFSPSTGEYEGQISTPRKPTLTARSLVFRNIRFRDLTVGRVRYRSCRAFVSPRRESRDKLSLSRSESFLPQPRLAVAPLSDFTILSPYWDALPYVHAREKEWREANTKAVTPAGTIQDKLDIWYIADDRESLGKQKKETGQGIDGQRRARRKTITTVSSVGRD
ncbi:hypothetical protein EDB84DRAFT_1679342 [Lactarius hengduanensis]|nr:hypothetical protein EDB84DRAFT_1679342 [Lactarius hengduanensis]